MTFMRCIGLALTFWLASPTLADNGGIGLYLYAIPGDPLPEGAFPAQTITLSGPGTSALVEQLAATNLDAVQLDDGTLSVQLAADAVFQSPPAPEHSAASFVLNFNDERVRAIVPDSGIISHQHLLEVVDRHIADKTYAQGFDIATQVAASRKGDCTEHAVLTAALARSVGIPARVTLGVLIAARAGGVEAFGHAWAELYDGEQWQVADATALQALEDGEIYYVPLMLLTDESPGYAMDLMQLVTIRPEQVSFPAPPDSSG